MDVISTGIVDYGAGNLGNVVRALDWLEVDNRIISSRSDLSDLNRVNALILPGVGSFGEGMRGLSRRGLKEPLKKAAAAGKPLLGICLGMQLLFSGSEEASGVEGLDFFSGYFRRFQPEKTGKIPHMGWNKMKFCDNEIDRFYSGEAADPYFYFVHSYYMPAGQAGEDLTLATCRYGEVEFVAAVTRDNITAVQPHPEKSGRAGLAFLKYFLEEANNEGDSGS